MKVVYCIGWMLLYVSVCRGQDKNSLADSDIHQNSNDTVGIVHVTDQPANYLGGSSAWSHFLIRNLKSEQALIEMQRKKVQQQTAVVQFVVCTDGTICEVQVLNEVLPSIRKEAERVIKKSGKWIPAQREGKKVKAYKQQSITFINYN